MNTKVASLLQPHLESVLKNRIKVLSDWRRQRPGLSGRTKSFEGWLLVELVHHLLANDIADEVRTNGHLGGHRVAVTEVMGLRGTKGKAKHLSSDIAVHLAGRPDKQYLTAELKVGLSGIPVRDEIRIVRAYKRLKVCERAEFGWIVLLPEKDPARRSAEKAFTKIYQQIAQDPENADFDFAQTSLTDWLRVCVAFPRR